MRHAPPWLLDHIADVQGMSAIERERLRVGIGNDVEFSGRWCGWSEDGSEK
jgi:hypothetical protein